MAMLLNHVKCFHQTFVWKEVKIKILTFNSTRRLTPDRTLLRWGRIAMRRWSSPTGGCESRSAAWAGWRGLSCGRQPPGRTRDVGRRSHPGARWKKELQQKVFGCWRVPGRRLVPGRERRVGWRRMRVGVQGHPGCCVRVVFEVDVGEVDPWRP